MKQVGGLVHAHWLGRADVTVEGARIIQSWDTGVKAGDTHDPSACATFAVVEGVHHLIDMLVVRLEYPELKRAMVNHAARFNPEAILIEDKASGQSLLQDLRRETELPVLACMPDADKLTRLMRVTPLMEAGKVALPTYAPWLAAFEAELFSFPDGAHDDQVDAVSQYLNWVRGRGNPSVMRVRRL
jgi:predicted phage terminase large subunit-like protein